VAAAACGRIGYLPEQGPGDAGVPPGDGRDATSGNAVDADPESAVGTDSAPATDVTTSADATQDTASPVDAPDDTQSGDASQVPEAGSDGSDGSPGDAAPTDAAVLDGEAGPSFFVCDSSACCCAYVCKYATVPMASTCSGASDTAQYGFESGTQGWVLADATDVLIAGHTDATMTERIAGSSALQATLAIPAGSFEYVRYIVPPVAPVAGAVVTFHVWVAPGAALQAIQPYVMDKNYVWTGSWVEMGQLVPGCWATITLAVPTTVVAPAYEIGVEFTGVAGAPYNGVVYVDAVEW
jgi:hypothetical protein